MDESGAIRRMKQGDISGLAFLVECYQVKAARAAYLITQDRGLAEDVVQDTFIRLFQRIRHFDETRPFEPYLMRSVVNAALNTLRQDGRVTSLEGDPHEVEILLDHSTSVESQVENQQLAGQILVAIARLSPRQRAAIVQRYYLGLSEAEMALALGAPPGTVKWLLHAGRTRLRNLLGKEGRAE